MQLFISSRSSLPFLLSYAVKFERNCHAVDNTESRGFERFVHFHVIFLLRSLYSRSPLLDTIARFISTCLPVARCSLASALASVSDHGGIIRTVKRRFDECENARASLARATEEARTERESRKQLKQAQSDKESSLREEVFGGINT